MTIELFDHQIEDAAFLAARKFAGCWNDMGSGKTLIALEAARCLLLTSWVFKARMKVQPELALKVLPAVVKRFRETNETLLALSRR